METKTLSSRLTFFYKYVFSIVWITGFGAGTSALWLGALHDKNGQAVPEEMKWVFLLGWLLGTAAILWNCTRLKRVRLGPDALLVSNYRREISVPFALIAKVTENGWINIRPVTIHFRTPTEFGDAVTFMPQARFLFPWNTHPVVEELRRAAGVSPGRP